jgi:hypothetical protein
MIRLTCAFVLTLSVFVGVATAFAQDSVAGGWTLIINGPQGAIDSDVTFTQDGDKVTGTMSGPQGESAVSGTMAGSTLTLAFNVVTPNGPIDIKMTAEVAGADMKGTLDFGMGTADFTGKKK